MRFRHVLLILATLATTAAAVSAGDERRGKAYTTPQEVFDAAKQAVAMDNWKKAFECLTPESRDLLTGTVVLVGAQMEKSALAEMGKAKDDETKAFVRKIIKAMLEPITKVYTKHGLTEDVLKKLEGADINLLAPNKGKPDWKKLKPALVKAAKQVKDQPAFLGEWMQAMKKLLKAFGQGGDAALFDVFPKDARLEDVKIEGDIAKGFIVGKKRGRERREPIEFKKDQRGWLIELPLDQLAGKGAEEKSKDKGARAPAGVRDVFGSVARPAARALTAWRGERLRGPALAVRQRRT